MCTPGLPDYKATWSCFSISSIVNTKNCIPGRPLLNQMRPNLAGINKFGSIPMQNSSHYKETPSLHNYF